MMAITFEARFVREWPVARGELLRNLFLSHKRGDEDAFSAVALEIIGEEIRKNNHQLARDLQRILENGNNGSRFQKSLGELTSLPRDRERRTLLVDVHSPERRFGEILLRPEAKATVERIIEEQSQAEILRTHALKPKSKLLFCGPPGCGKTLCAEVIASELGLPVLYTRFDAIISSYLGETSANLRKVFDYAAGGRWVVLFDEFDAIGKERDDPNEHGELKRVINSFLQLLDGFQSTSLLIAATNHEQLLDPALWRRFDEILFFPKPSTAEILKLSEMKLKNFPHPGLNLRAFAPRFRGLAHADVERVCLDAIKTCVLREKESLDDDVFTSAIMQQKVRTGVTRRALSRQRH